MGRACVHKLPLQPAYEPTTFSGIKYVVGQQQKSNDTFMSYIKEKNGHNERITNEFSERVKESQNVLRDLTAEIATLRPQKGRR